MKFKTSFFLTLSMLLAAGAGCGRHSAPSRDGFDIPPSLVFRMYQAHNDARDRRFGNEGPFDGEEMMALMMLGFPAGHEIASRPRGGMEFADDGLSEKERENLWPFDIETFEAELEARMERDEDGLYRRKDEDGELQPSNPTIRWVNREIESWAVERLNAQFERVDAETHGKLVGPGEDGDGTPVWVLSENGGAGEYFCIERDDGAWNGREYVYLLWNGGDEPFRIASFDSFPNRKEAAAARLWRTDGRALNNLAVLLWRHRIFRLRMDPREIRFLLGKAAESGVPQAERNLSVLMDHIPELEEMPEP